MYGDLEHSEIRFGAFKGQLRWKSLQHIPDQRIRDSLEQLIVVQGDTEFASVEQQRNLLATAPTDYDLDCLARVMCEEMRHGVQMSHILITHFGYSGRIEAQSSWSGTPTPTSACWARSISTSKTGWISSSTPSSSTGTESSS
jgi:hypothetical protein